jgi:putative PIN family toxin of toxin-antitoxin system
VRILLDTNILVRAAITPNGLARKIVDRIRADEKHVLVISAYILTEIADVLNRPRMRSRWPLSTKDIQQYCQFLSALAEEVAIRPVPAAIADPKDQPVIEAAIAGRADVICTGGYPLRRHGSQTRSSRVWNQGCLRS